MKFPLPRGMVRLIGTPLLNALARSWRFRTFGPERLERAVADHRPHVFLLWHEAIFPLLWWHRGQGIAIVVSLGREGQYIGDYASGLGYRILPGSSSRGGARALLGAVRVLEEGGPVAITPDGPRGPHRCLKPGVVQAAQRAGAWIVPLHAVASPAWRLGTWDRLAIPKPRARITVGYGEPFLVAGGTGGLAEGITRCREAMIGLEREMQQG
jgi:lysophospholipid acyltransferase (LPLAT)-like uncharacterized protein